MVGGGIVCIVHDGARWYTGGLRAAKAARVLVLQLELWLSEVELLRECEDEAVKERRVDPRVDAAVGIPPPGFSTLLLMSGKFTCTPSSPAAPVSSGFGGQRGLPDSRKSRAHPETGGKGSASVGGGGGGTKRD